MSFTTLMPETPQRALPGTFFNTPAASRFGPPPQQPIFSQALDARRRQSTSAPSSSRDQIAPVATQNQTLPPIQRAARTINDVLQREASFPELDSYVRQGTSSDYELPGTSTDAPWAPFARSRMFDIPDAIFEQYNRAEVSTMMGLFAELNHAWITIDNALYLWDYTNPNPEIKGYEDQPNTITAVQLVVPKPGVFVSQVNYMLVVATNVDIQLLGLSAVSDDVGTISVQIYQTKLSQGTRGLNVRRIAGSDATGRIFFSSDNDVYEIIYHAEERWFKNRTSLKHHTSTGYGSLLPNIWSGKTQEVIEDMIVDDSRRLLYTLSSESTIRTFYFGTPEGLQPAIEKKRQEFLRDISHMLSGTQLLTPAMKIVSISAISAQEGSKLHLMATTSTGVRLFLSATRGYGYSAGNAGAPQSMQVQHVRFPPRVDDGQSQAVASASNEPPLETNSAALVTSRMGIRFPPGFFFCFVEKPDSPGRDNLFLSSPDTGRIAAQHRDPSTQQWKYYEQGCWLGLNSKAEAVGLVTKSFSAANQPMGFGNELAEQFDQTPSEVAILTNTGVHLIRRRRLVDVFAAAIRKGSSDEGLDAEVKKFIRQYGRGETAATALAVACGQGSDVASGGHVVRISDPETLELARRTFVEYGGRPSLNENSVPEAAQQAIDSVRPSSRHEGLSLYVGRLVRSIWKRPMITQLTSPNGFQIVSTVSRQKLSVIQDELTKLQQFLEKNKTFIEGLAGPESLQRVQSQQEQIALQGEHQALHSLQKLISNIIEGISFAQMFFDEQVERVFAALDDTMRQKLRDLTYELLFASDTGREIAKTLVKAIVNRNIENGSNVDTVAEALRRRCGSFCSADDVIVFKAQEQLKKASEIGGSSDRGRSLLNESLRLFKQVAGALSFENLQAAVNEFANLKFFAGAFSLALVVARESDRGNRALSWVKDNRPTPDSREAQYIFRKKCYDIIFQTMNIMHQNFGSDPEVLDGRPTRAATIQAEANAQINESEDELFHFELYTWYLGNAWIDRLLAVDSPFVADFLSKSSESSLKDADLLWQYHARREQFYEAAMVQLNLAKSQHDVSLAKRMEYLSRAKANASTPTTGVGRQTRQVLLYEITELLDVANIQDELLSRLRGDPRAGDKVQELTKPLNGQVLDLSTLFNDYADSAGYFDICLLIYEAADHRNEADIAGAWESLIAQTHQQVVEEPNAAQLPYEAVVTEIKDMSHRLNGSENTFNPQMLIPLIERYALEHQRDVGSDRWVPDLFMAINFPFEASIAVIQQLWYGNVAPFTGAGNRVLASHILHLVGCWFDDCLGRNERAFGSVENARDIGLLLDAVSNGASGLKDDDRVFIEQLKRRVGRSYR